jgi:protein-S-isoprenylcysteine O-methyltransferase Ste14
MNKTDEVHGSPARRGLLPPRALLFSLLAQIPLISWSWPLQPGRLVVLGGVLALAAGAALNIWAERLFRKAGVGVCPFSRARELVANGPYRFTRNPMYLGMVLISFSGALMMGVLWNTWPAVLLAVWLHFRFVLPEEDFLQEQLGVAYLAYASRTARWFGLPGFRVAGKAGAEHSVR